MPRNENHRIENDIPEITHGPGNPLLDNIEPIGRMYKV